MSRSLTSPELVTLLILQERPSYGYELLHEERLCKAYAKTDINPSSVYHLLHSLANRNLLEHITVSAPHAPSKRIYRLSKQGTTHLREHLGTELSGIRNELDTLVANYRLGMADLKLMESLLRPLS